MVYVDLCVICLSNAMLNPAGLSPEPDSLSQLHHCS